MNREVVIEALRGPDAAREREHPVEVVGGALAELLELATEALIGQQRAVGAEQRVDTIAEDEEPTLVAEIALGRIEVALCVVRRRRFQRTPS